MTFDSVVDLWNANSETGCHCDDAQQQSHVMGQRQIDQAAASDPDICTCSSTNLRDYLEHSLVRVGAPQSKRIEIASQRPSHSDG